MKLSRAMRTCRATTHADLATLIQPINNIYYCAKHGKICKPLFSMHGWWERYSKDTMKRLIEFDKLRTNTKQFCLIGDSRSVHIVQQLEYSFPSFASLIKEKKINGIFTSPLMWV